MTTRIRIECRFPRGYPVPRELPVSYNRIYLSWALPYAIYYGEPYPGLLGDPGRGLGSLPESAANWRPPFAFVVDVPGPLVAPATGPAGVAATGPRGAGVQAVGGGVPASSRGPRTPLNVWLARSEYPLVVGDRAPTGFIVRNRMETSWYIGWSDYSNTETLDSPLAPTVRDPRNGEILRVFTYTLSPDRIRSDPDYMTPGALLSYGDARGPKIL